MCMHISVFAQTHSLSPGGRVLCIWPQIPYWKQPFSICGSLSSLCRITPFSPWQPSLFILPPWVENVVSSPSACFTHTSSQLPLSAEPLKKQIYVCAPAQGAVYSCNYSNLWVIAVQVSLGLEHTQRKRREGGVFRRWRTKGGDTALCLCECV